MSTCTITYTDPVLGDRVFTREQFKQFVLNNPALFSEMVSKVKSEVKNTVMKSPITVNDYVNSELENSIFLFDPRNDSNFEEHFNKCKR